MAWLANCGDTKSEVIFHSARVRVRPFPLERTAARALHCCSRKDEGGPAACATTDSANSGAGLGAGRECK